MTPRYQAILDERYATDEELATQRRQTARDLVARDLVPALWLTAGP